MPSPDDTAILPMKLVWKTPDQYPSREAWEADLLDTINQQIRQ